MRFLGIIAIMTVLLGSALGLVARSNQPERPIVRSQILSSAYDQLSPGVTTLSGLARLGFDTGNARRISELGMMEQFLRGDSIDFDALDPALKQCLSGQVRCAGYVFPLTDMPGTRAVVVTVKDRVAYKTLSGQILTSAAAEVGLPSRY
jgi:hypothetical protein